MHASPWRTETVSDETASKANNNLLVFRAAHLQIIRQTRMPYVTKNRTVSKTLASRSVMLAGELS